MIRAFHFIWTCYGWWFPNDPRGSWSDEVWQPTIRDLGERHLGRRPIQPTPAALRRWLADAQRHLRHDPVVLDGTAACAAANGIGRAAQRYGYVAHALCVMPDHAHSVVRWHARGYERMVADMKSWASRWVRRSMDVPTGQRRPIWSRGYWVRFLGDDAAIRSAVRYVERNPTAVGLRRQRWSFLVPV